jgi:hypothetical protein
MLVTNELRHFERWLNLNFDSLTWESRNQDKFENFWNGTFKKSKSLIDFSILLDECYRLAKRGPLKEWFSWLKDQIIIFDFITKNSTIKEIAASYSISIQKVGYILHNFFVEKLPLQIDEIDEIFLISDIYSDVVDLNYENLQVKLEVDMIDTKSIDHGIMRDLEVTLFESWEFLQRYYSENKKQKILKEYNYQEGYFFRILKFFQELMILFFIGGLIIFSLKYVNKLYENYLAGKVEIFEPDFLWLDKSLTFREIIDGEEVVLSYKELEDLEKIQSTQSLDIVDEERFDPESDVVLSSLDSGPLNIELADSEKSKYEEDKKGGYRDFTYGRRKAYRVLINADSARMTKNEINDLIAKYQAVQADTVIPGTEVPGGIYFNLYVPMEGLLEFLREASKTGDSVIYESKTRVGAPANQNKVFIWIKSI